MTYYALDIIRRYTTLVINLIRSINTIYIVMDCYIFLVEVSKIKFQL